MSDVSKDSTPFLEVRRLELSEAPLLAEHLSYHQSSFFDWDLDKVKIELRYDEVWALIDTRLPDFILSFVIVAPRGPGCWEIIAIATHPHFLQKGHSQFLLERLFNAKHPSPESPPVEWWLEVHEQNQSALKLYRKLGFEEKGRRSRYYRDGGAAITMTKMA